MYPPSALGPGRKNFLLDRLPSAAHHLLSDERRVRLTQTHLGPLGPWWLRDRFEGKVEVHDDCQILEATDTGSGLWLKIGRAGKAGWELRTDHLVCGTGYEIDVDRHPLLDPPIRALLERIVRAMLSFGPLFRFVSGAAYAAPTVARHLAREVGIQDARARSGKAAAAASARL
jgi:hypothetical protein